MAAPNTIFYVPAHDVQRPTVSRLHIRDARDAQVLFEAVRTGILKPVVRRLNDPERAAFIKSGSVFVWQESDDELGLKRWTDGLIWSASRMRDPFLFYEARLKSNSRNSRDSDGPEDSSSLVKQTYSAIVTDPQNPSLRRKWHLTAYFTHADFHQLPTIQEDVRLRNIVLPPGVYRSGKSRQSLRSLEMEMAPDHGSGSTGYSSSNSSPSNSPSSCHVSPLANSAPPPLSSHAPYSHSHRSSPAYPSASPLPQHASPISYRPDHLPPIHTAITEHRHQEAWPARTRSQEDERLIRLLDSRGSFA